MKTKTKHQLRVEEFMRLADERVPGLQGVPDRPTVPSQDVRRLILEEALETVEALGFNPVYDGVVGLQINMENVMMVPRRAPVELSEIADGCGDLSVVSIGTLSACGIPDKPILQAIDQNNLDKFGPGCSVDEHGKLTKPPGFHPPDLKSIIDMVGKF